MRKNQVLRATLAILTVVTAVTYLNAFIVWNDIPPVFETAETQALEELTVEGTSFFLQSNADVFLLLNEVEVGYGRNFDFAYALELADSAVRKLENARSKYIRIISKAEHSSHEKFMIKRLETFDYTRFIETHRLNGQIMAELKSYLLNGDIDGLYAKNIENIDGILQRLYSIRSLLSESKQPTISSFWSLLHQYTDAILLGNYASMTFVNIM